MIAGQELVPGVLVFAMWLNHSKKLSELRFGVVMQNKNT